MLTPQEISGKEFVKAVFGGYDMSVVDDFLETLTADYSALYKENAILKSKIKVLVEKVEEYRSTDDAMRMALLTAQKMSEEITSEAKKKSEEMLQKADQDVRERLNEMKSKFAGEEERLKSLKSETNKYIKASQEILRQHSQFLTKLDDISNEMELPLKDNMPEPLYNEEPLQSREELFKPREETVEEPTIKIDQSFFDASEPESESFTKVFNTEEPETVKKTAFEADPEVDEPTSPRPKFDFDDLKFGKNYTGD